jgi:hypothetical protein
MPLTEISANIRRNGSQTQRSGQALASRQGQTPSKLKSNAVSNMLRTSTETGDIGQFAVRPSRLPRSASRIPTRSRSGSVHALATSLRPSTRRQIPRYDSRHLPRPVPSFSALSRHDTVRSNLTSYHNNPRTRCRVAPRAPYGLDRRPSPATSSGLYSHSSFLTLRGRQGYRPASPALSDAHSMPVYDGRHAFHRAASVATAASSPVSMFNRAPPYSFREVNNSTSSLSRLPSPAIPGSYPGIRRSPFPSRNPTPVSGTLPHAARHPNGSVESFHTLYSATGTTTPLYYDYTEAFADDYCLSAVQDRQISPLFSEEHTIPEQGLARLPRQAQTPFGMAEGSVFKPCEMPTQHNRTRSEQSKESCAEGNMIHKSPKEGDRISEDDSDEAKVSLGIASQPLFLDAG